ncbi:MAG: hypothetical protein QM715_11270 [Nibricoccus sp.]
MSRARLPAETNNTNNPKQYEITTSGKAGAEEGLKIAGTNLKARLTAKSTAKSARVMR